MVTNLHKGTEVMDAKRKQPQLTKTNKNNIKPVWGDNYVKEIKIPTFVDNYNNTMNGVDKADQLISYYCPKL